MKIQLISLFTLSNTKKIKRNGFLARRGDTFRNHNLFDKTTLIQIV